MTAKKIQSQLNAKPITEKQINEFEFIDHAYFIDVKNSKFYQLK